MTEPKVVQYIHENGQMREAYGSKQVGWVHYSDYAHLAEKLEYCQNARTKDIRAQEGNIEALEAERDEFEKELRVARDVVNAAEDCADYGQDALLNALAAYHKAMATGQK